MNSKIPFVITEDIRTITRGMPFHVSEKTAKNVSSTIVKICEEYITPHVILLSEKKMTAWVGEVTPSNAIIQTLAYTELLDKNYPQLQLTRANIWQESQLVIVPRSGCLDIDSQFGLIKKGDYVLVDDVIFSGEGAVATVLKGREYDRNIKEVICCVSIGVGKDNLSKIGVQVKSLYHFKEVIDELCSRDFIPGLPFSGRPYIQNHARFPFAQGHTSPMVGEHKFVPYLLPWGDPSARMSVPKENVVRFSIACIDLGIEFWLKTAPWIKLSQIPAPIYDLHVDESEYFVDYLHQCKKILET